MTVKIVDSFCEGKYFASEKLKKKDLDNLDEIRANEKYKETIDKLTQYRVINQKEFKQCQNLVKNQPKD
ncbi:MAG: hypothetical protein FJ368_05885 [Pelagibacterales bacterium]|nr:hypothetical protein [Pelagibacterales bacterium]